MRFPYRSMAAPAARQGGIVLFVALIVMVALSLAGVALVRSVDTTTAVVGNLAFRQAALLPANMAVEEANAALFESGAIGSPDADVPAQNYFAARLGNDDARGVPFQLQQKKNFALPKILYIDNNLFEVRYVIERSCRVAGPASAANCDMMPPKQSPGGEVNAGPPPDLPRIPFYRLTVRVDGPQNTTAFLQAMLR